MGNPFLGSVKYDRKGGEPTTCMTTIVIPAGTFSFETPNANAFLDAIEAAGMLDTEIPG